MELAKLLTSIIQYKFSSDKKQSSKTIVDHLETCNPIWKKFAQLLANRPDLIDKDLCVELQRITNKNPYNLVYAQNRFRADFKRNDTLTIVGSGTIAATYLLRSDTNAFVVKILHEGIRKQIQQAKNDFSIVKGLLSYILPANFINFTDYFIESVFEQMNFSEEFRKGKLMKQILRGKNSLFIVPEMLHFTENCLLMTYEESSNLPDIIESKSILPNEVATIARGLLMLQIVSIKNQLIHSDLHFGNFGVRRHKKELKIVLYDFGLVLDLTTQPKSLCLKLAKAFGTRSSIELVNTIITKREDQDALIKLCGNDNFSDDLRNIILFSQLKSIPLPKEIMSLLFALIPCEGFEKLLIKYSDKVISHSEFIKNYKTILPYTDFEGLDSLLL